MRLRDPKGVRGGLRAVAVAIGLQLLSSPASAQNVPADEASVIAQEAYIYLYPLISMDVTRRQATNVEAGKMVGRGPMNTFTHIRQYPTADFREVVRPNFDTLYSIGWLDLTRGPVIVSTPDTQDRYYLLPMMDMWSDVFAVPGKRTSGTRPANYAVVPPGWNGTVPSGVKRIASPTPFVWIIGRTQTNGPNDYDAVHKVQDGYKITPLSRWPKAPEPAPTRIDPDVDMKTPPLQQVNAMPAEKYFAYGAELMKMNPPHVTDWSSLARFERIGLVAGKSCDPSKLDPAVRSALVQGAASGLKQMQEVPMPTRVVNGWQTTIEGMGVYGNNYLKRAVIAMIGLGANQPDDAIYPLNIGDAEGKPLTGDQKYVLHFDKNELPPAAAFWSVTMYDAEGFQVANPLNRFALGDRDPLKYAADGSLDIYIQNSSPGADKASNWLPSPASGTLGVTMRLYAPKPEALDGRWNPSAIRRAQ